jgi:hypothetical protein
MRITNDLNLPRPIVDAIKNDPYVPGDSDISVTQLIAPARQQALLKANGDELVRDASDMVWALMGHAIHAILEQSGVKYDANAIVERRFYAEFDGTKVGGQIDYYEDRTLTDYKMMSVWEVIYGLSPEKTAQLNILRLLMSRNDIPVEAINIVAIFRDWSKSKARYDKQFPKQQVQVIPVDLWPLERTAEYVRDRLKAHAEARAGALPDCTPEERWAKPDQYAIMKDGRKSALRLLPTHDDAMGWAGDKGFTTGGHLHGGYEIVLRPGENVRCQDYCDAAPFCNQWKELNQ